MKPEFPFNDFTHYNEVFHNKMNRWMVCLYNSKTKKRKTISKARYIYSVWLWNTKGELIPEGMEVDHINDDKTDDRIENLQLLTRLDNVQKENLLKGKSFLLFQCPVCLKYSFREKNNSNLIVSKSNVILFCCKEHSYLFRSVYNQLSIGDINNIIKEQQIMCVKEYNNGDMIIEQIFNSYKSQFIWNILHNRYYLGSSPG